eukprot:scaffold149567_cov17-Tisochrysis_lutea.AAC.2
MPPIIHCQVQLEGREGKGYIGPVRGLGNHRLLLEPNRSFLSSNPWGPKQCFPIIHFWAQIRACPSCLEKVVYTGPSPSPPAAAVPRQALCAAPG